MIAAIQYQFNGHELLTDTFGTEEAIRVDGAGEDRVDGLGDVRVSETVMVGIWPVVYIHPMSGHRCLDVIFKGYSLEIGLDCLVDESTGAVQILLPTARKDELLVMFTTIPRFFVEEVETPPIEPPGDESHDFVIGDDDFIGTEFY